MTHHVVYIPGDGIGPEIAAAARKVVDATGVDIVWHEHEAGGAQIDRYGTPLPPDTLDAIRQYGVALKGPITTPIGKGFRYSDSSSVCVCLPVDASSYLLINTMLSKGSRLKFAELPTAPEFVAFIESIEVKA